MKLDPEIKRLTAEAMVHGKRLQQAKDEISKVIVGQEEIIEGIMMAMVADGHVLLEGVPGLAKTMLIKTFSETIDADFRRLQFTPDLLPADIMGTKVYHHKAAEFTTQKGPIFANIILADEINRAPPKVQSALLEAMQEYQVTISGTTIPLKRPFLVLATQNPIETEGTYMLPEAQVDRFMFKLIIGYPTKEEEKEIMRRMTGGPVAAGSRIYTQKEILTLQSFCRTIYCDETVMDYVSSIVDCTRHPQDYGLKIDGHIEYGASPRASIWLVLAAKAKAIMMGRGYVTPEDIQDVCAPVLRHRIILSFEAEAEGVTQDSIIKSILENVKVP